MKVMLMNKEGLEKLIKELEQERKEVEMMTGGAGEKLPDWARVTEKESFYLIKVKVILKNYYLNYLETSLLCLYNHF